MSILRFLFSNEIHREKKDKIFNNISFIIVP